MRIRQVLFSTVAAIGIAAMAATVPDPLAAQQSVVAIDKDDIGGVVAGPGGPEAGVWVIAETTDLPTKYAKIVVTDGPGPLRRPGPADRELPGLGARLRPRRLSQDAGETRPTA